jgi:hypothetical protein
MLSNLRRACSFWAASVSWRGWLRTVFVLELLTLVVGQLAALHSVQSVLRMPFAMAEQDITVCEGWK